jgi:hypothetical protein
MVLVGGEQDTSLLISGDTPGDTHGDTPLSSLAYPMITCTPLVAGNLPIKTLVAR